MTPRPFVEATALDKRFGAGQPWWQRLAGRPAKPALQAVDGVSFSIEEGRTLGLVGESGCGKSTLARLMVGLHAPDAGEVRVGGQPLRAPGGPVVQMIFQDPYASLNPRWAVGDIVAEPLVERSPRPVRSVREARVGELLQAVGLVPADRLRHPHQFSGGQRQRISIARALASEPSFLVCDEPTSALDVSVQAQVLNLLMDVREQRGMTCLFISHNLAVVRHVSDDVGVMYAGRVVEQAPTSALFDRPRHPYTQLLLAAVPDLGGRRLEASQAAAVSDVPASASSVTGCAFHPRCPLARERCRHERPALEAVGNAHTVACHAVAEGRD